MKCPLRMITRPGLMQKASYPDDDCKEKECAWWVDSEKKCSITILALEAAYKLWDRDRPKGYEGG